MLANVPLAKASYTPNPELLWEGTTQGQNYQVESSIWPLKVQLPTTTQETNIGLDEARLEDEKHSWGMYKA